VVVRNARSGSTHLLEALAGEVLMALIEAGAGLTVHDLVARFCAEPASDENAEWPDAIQSVLSEFRRLGLAEPQEP
jgi:PqqD family protein of HPr-rel-A system